MCYAVLPKTDPAHTIGTLLVLPKAPRFRYQHATHRYFRPPGQTLWQTCWRQIHGRPSTVPTRQGGLQILRMSYRYNGKQRLLALGVDPAVPLACARQLRDEHARWLAPASTRWRETPWSRCQDVGRVQHLREHGAGLPVQGCAQPYAKYARENTAWFERNVLLALGAKPISAIGPRDVLTALQKIEARGATSPLTRSSNCAAKCSASQLPTPWRSAT